MEYERYRAAAASSFVSFFLTSFICIIIGVMIKNDFWTGLVPFIWLVGGMATTGLCGYWFGGEGNKPD